MEADHSALFEKIKSHGQEHLIAHYESIADPVKKAEFLKQISEIDLDLAHTLYEDVYKKPNKKLECKFDLIKDILTQQDIAAQEKELSQIGLEAISRGEVAMCIMSGGQGTRLGFDHPKGMYKIGLQSGKTLFEFFSQRLQSLMRLVKLRFPNSKYTDKNMITWLIMTSEMNNQEIQDFFKEHNYWGYDPSAIVFFPQGGLPALDYHGKVIIEGEGKLSLAPGGNGAIYYEMKRHNVINRLKDNGVKIVHIGGIDNILLKLADPVCLGFMIKNKLQIVSKYTDKRAPDEKVGIHVINNGKVEVCEYSETPEHYKKEVDEHGKLKYKHSFLAFYFMTTDFLDKITSDHKIMAEFNKKYHIAEKKITIWDPVTKKSVKAEKNTGIKFELFCFDCFDLSNSFGLFEVKREEEFAPVKNATGEDSPQSARLLISNLHYKWLTTLYNINFDEAPNASDKLCEIDARLTYNGENLDQHVSKYTEGSKGKLPLYIH